MVIAVSAAHDKPLSDLNTTPLIDVMLVLLVMVIMSVPLPTHSLTYDLPGGSPPPVVFDPVRNRLTIEANDRIQWNGAAVTKHQLAAILERAAAMRPEPQLEFAPNASASYLTSAQVLQLVKASGATNFGFVGNEKYREFDRGR